MTDIIETDSNPTGWPTRKTYPTRHYPKVGDRVTVIYQSDGTEHTATVTHKAYSPQGVIYEVRQDYNGLHNVFASNQIRPTRPGGIA